VTDDLFERSLDAAMNVPGVATALRRDTIAAALRAAQAVYAADERAYIDGQVAEAKIAHWRMEDGVTDIRIVMARETAAGLVTAAKTFLAATGAENYVEQHVTDRETGERYTLTVQRPGKSTPHELRRQAEAERDALAEIGVAAGLLRDHYGDDIPADDHILAVCDAVDGYRRDHP
jgi:hypothetical protein